MGQRIQSLLFTAFTLLFTGALTAADPEILKLWPNGVPGGIGEMGAEADTTTPKEGLVAGKRVIRLGNVSEPTMTIFRPSQQTGAGSAVLVFPGGGYRILAMDLEGTEVCEWLKSLGITAVLVKYRVPAGKTSPRQKAPLQDAQRALGLVRFHAKEWHIDPDRIGVAGFSAGGHLAAALSNNFDQRTYDVTDESDRVSCRPDFALLIYPAYLTVKDEGDKIAPDLPVSARTPPSFLVQAEDDGVRVENSLFYYLALKNAKVPAEMHLYSHGGHGYGLRATEATVTSWPKAAEVWLRSSGFIR
ncbi:MAG: alpha/beta hydrolase [Acidobacteriota bacterium]|nr:alpha/beta hydrolase [Acidobacteriota bacterium]